MSTLIMAVIAAVGALLAGITAHEALMDKTTEIIDITIAENDRVSVEVLKSKVEILTELGQLPDPTDLALIQAYEAEIQKFETEAEDEEDRAQSESATNLILAVAVTVLSMGITLSGMAIITDQKFIWISGLVCGAAGGIGVAYGIYTMIS